MRRFQKLIQACFIFASIGLPIISLAQTASVLASDKGCYSCHGSTPRKNAPTFDQLAKSYAKHQGQPDTASMLAEKLRAKHMFGRIPAHEQLTQENALLLTTWLIDGAK